MLHYLLVHLNVMRSRVDASDGILGFRFRMHPHTFSWHSNAPEVNENKGRVRMLGQPNHQPPTINRQPANRQPPTANRQLQVRRLQVTAVGQVALDM